MEKILYHIYDAQTFEITGAGFFEEGTQPENSTLQKNTGFVKAMYNPLNDTIYEGATPEEILVAQEIQEETEDKIEYSTILEAGKELFIKHQMRLLRRVKKGALTKVRAATVRTLLTDTYVLLNLGFWDLANTKVLAIPVQNNAGIQNEIDWLKEKIAEYLPTTNLRIG